MLQPGDLVFIRGTEGLAGPIKKFTRSPYTHIAGLAIDGELIESQALRRTGYQSLETYRGVADVYTCKVLSPEQRHQIVDFVKREVGGKYDYFLFGWLAFRSLLGNAMPSYFGSKRHICTTLWADAYKQVGIELCPHTPYPTPGELSASKLLQHVGSF
ncbi:hypothetical protein [Alicyclobacillus ferrooxydans]|uniref:LRAT domain-containing protein n=1 Tax=Alicyclobacillus ferrooxydans TaxID=471514 RepID=A0A0P9GR24_9BACL|nr:hypothetical protein [Alicyclobacillus ferrooxydans]KPV43350.1 hypothetical protein AN477_12950 [Alicyclobacillus ferrooxydans]